MSSFAPAAAAPARIGTLYPRPAPAPSPFTRAPVSRVSQKAVSPPNILLAVLDDFRFGATSAFGGRCRTPAFEAIADNGLKFLRFGQGAPEAKASLAESLRLKGYTTARFGRCLAFGVNPAEPGFEYVYGQAAGESLRFLSEDEEERISRRISASACYQTERMTDKALGWLRQIHKDNAAQPFFACWTPRAPQSHIQVEKAWVEPYWGAFDHWDQLGPDMSRDRITRMEAYAGFIAQTDFHFGRILETLKVQGVLNNTLIIVMTGNGAVPRPAAGVCSEAVSLREALQLEPADFMRTALERTGGPDTYIRGAAGWAGAMCARYRWTCETAPSFGGLTGGMLVHWPEGMAARGDVRTEFHDTNDIAPTVCAASGATWCGNGRSFADIFSPAQNRPMRVS